MFRIRASPVDKRLRRMDDGRISACLCSQTSQVMTAPKFWINDDDINIGECQTGNTKEKRKVGDDDEIGMLRRLV